jgi:hypothetical protein
MRIFITSTPPELTIYQTAACEVVRELGFEPVLRRQDDAREPAASCARQISEADAVLAIVGWRRGDVPAPEIGGDGLHPWVWWEIESATMCAKPVMALLAADAWRGELREAAAAAVDNLRGTLSPRVVRRCWSSTSSRTFCVRRYDTLGRTWGSCSRPRSSTCRVSTARPVVGSWRTDTSTTARSAAG